MSVCDIFGVLTIRALIIIEVNQLWLVMAFTLGTVFGCNSEGGL